MAFLYSVIGDNTIENREHLEKLGYKSLRFFQGKKYLYATTCQRANAKEVWNEPYYGTVDDVDFYVSCGFIPILGNPKLFKAVSAMRDDSDYMQFFVSKGWRDYYDDPIPDKWVLCTSNTLEEFGNVNNSPNSYSIPSFGWRKATLSELQAHFQRV